MLPLVGSWSRPQAFLRGKFHSQAILPTETGAVSHNVWWNDKACCLFGGKWRSSVDGRHPEPSAFPSRLVSMCGALLLGETLVAVVIAVMYAGGSLPADCIQALCARNGGRTRRRGESFVALDEYGVVQGLVTLEDVIEEIVGDIRDRRGTALSWRRPHSIVAALQDLPI